MIRASLLRSISDALEAHPYFAAEDFDVKQFDATEDEFDSVRIEYRHERKFFLAATIPNTKLKKPDGTGRGSYRISAEISPGEMGATETVEFSGQKQFIGGIETWIGWLDEEIKALPINRQIEDQRQKIAAMEVELASMPDEYLSVQEATSIKERIDALETLLRSNLEASGGDKAAVEGMVTRLHAEVEALKTQVDALKLPRVVAAVMSRVASWTRVPVFQTALGAGPGSVARRLVGKAPDESRDP